MDAFNNAITCGPMLRRILLESKRVTDMTEQIFPVVAPMDIKMPFVAYRRMDVDEASVKDERGPMAADYQFQVFCDNWKQSLELADAITGALCGCEDFPIRCISLSGASETYVAEANCFAQILDFKVRTY